MKTISGKVSYGFWNFLTGSFRIGKYDVHTGNMVRFFTLRASKQAKVRVDGNSIIEIIEAR